MQARHSYPDEDPLCLCRQEAKDAEDIRRIVALTLKYLQQLRQICDQLKDRGYSHVICLLREKSDYELPSRKRDDSTHREKASLDYRAAMLWDLNAWGRVCEGINICFTRIPKILEVL